MATQYDYCTISIAGWGSPKRFKIRWQGYTPNSRQNLDLVKRNVYSDILITIAKHPRIWRGTFIVGDDDQDDLGAEYGTWSDLQAAFNAADRTISFVPPEGGSAVNVYWVGDLLGEYFDPAGHTRFVPFEFVEITTT